MQERLDVELRANTRRESRYEPFALERLLERDRVIRAGRGAGVTVLSRLVSFGCSKRTTPRRSRQGEQWRHGENHCQTESEPDPPHRALLLDRQHDAVRPCREPDRGKSSPEGTVRQRSPAPE